jgi:2-polyprenyl-3-methyl-5-hydroxy-6-metoxy-1,4-benzoquinol methylase
MPNIFYKTVKSFPGWGKAEAFFQDRIDEYNVNSILEIGSGANPTISQNFAKKHGLEYTTNDINQEELDKAPSVYNRLLFDFSSANVPSSIKDSYDMVFSRMVNEHIKNGKVYYSNIFQVLKKGGITIHCFSTLFCLPFLINRITPEFISDKLLNFVSPREDNHLHGKFTAYYSWSRGPTKSMIKQFQNIGYNIIEYVGFFGHNYYLNRFPLLHTLEEIKSNFLYSQMRIPHLTSYAYVILQKP